MNDHQNQKEEAPMSGQQLDKEFQNESLNPELIHQLLEKNDQLHEDLKNLQLHLIKQTSSESQQENQVNSHSPSQTKPLKDHLNPSPPQITIDEQQINESMQVEQSETELLPLQNNDKQNQFQQTTLNPPRRK
jgi:hypothetical protein